MNQACAQVPQLRNRECQNVSIGQDEFTTAVPRPAPKVTVTRERVSLCQKGVTLWLLFLVNCFLASKRAKTSRGAGCVLHSTRPPAVEWARASLEGGPGGGLVGRVIHNGVTLNYLWLRWVLRAESAQRRDGLQALGHCLFQGKGI